MSTPASEAERQRRARLAHVRQELLAPVSSMAGYAQLLLERAGRSKFESWQADLDHIAASARTLHELVDRLLEQRPPGHAEQDDLLALQSELRHDLRTPLNAIKGYAELLLDELDEPGERGGEVLRADLEDVLREAESLLARIDSIIDFARGGGDAAPGPPSRADPLDGMLADLVRTVRPIGDDAGRTHETGRILIVDDNASNRQLLDRRLRHDGHVVTAAASGPQALSLLETDSFDLILLDLMMPDLNGFEVLARLKAHDRWHHIPVIMISALDETDSVIRCIEAGAEDYLPKPFNPVLLRARIDACLERKRWHDRERLYLERIEREKQKHDALLHNILPGQIVTRLSSGEAVIADRAEEATILFADLVGFAAVASLLSPTRLVDTLNRIFSEFDVLCRRHEVEKIKTIGDAYMVAAGVPDPVPDHAGKVAEFGLAAITALAEINAATDVPFEIRIGMHTGPVVAGVIGSHRFIYDVWGDTVNVASRLEAHGVPGRIHVSDRSRELLQDRFEFEPRGVIELKGVGPISTFFLAQPKADRIAP